jgi:CHAT domain-containing protein/tetratricopeptide (TPR) repeat protein
MDPQQGFLYYRDFDKDSQIDEFLSDIELSELRNFTAIYEVPQSDRDPNDSADSLKLLSRSFYHLYRNGGSLQDLQKSISKAEEGLATTDFNRPEFAIFLKDTVILWKEKYERTRSLDDLENAISQAEVMLTITQDSDPIRIPRLLGLVDVKQIKYRHTRSPADFEDAQAIAMEALSALGNMDHIPMSVYEQSVDRRVLEHVAGGQAPILDQQGLILRREFERTRDMNLLNKAIDNGRQAVAAAPRNSAQRADFSVNLVTSILRRFEYTSRLEDLNEAVKIAQEAVDTAPPNHSHRAWNLANLGLSLRLRFERKGDVKDIHMAIDAGKKSIDFLSLNDKERGGNLANLSVSLWRRFERLGNLIDIDESVIAGEEAVTLLPRSYAYRVSALGNLGTALMRRFERTGEIDNLNNAIKRTQEAVNDMPETHTDRGLALGTFGACLRYRFAHSGDLGALDKAIEVGEKALAATPNNHIEKVNRFSDLGGSYFQRWERTHQPRDLDQAINKGRQAIAILRTPTGFAVKDRATALNNLGIYLKCRFEERQNREDLREAIEIEEDAIRSTPDNHPDKANRYTNLSGALFRRYEVTNNLKDLDKAIEQGEMALKATPKDHPTRTGALNTVATCLSNRFRRTGVRSDLNRAIDLAEEGLVIKTAAPRQRIQSALFATGLLLMTSDWKKASKLTANAVELLPKISGRFLKQNDQQHLLSEFSGLASFAAASVLSAQESSEDACRAVELLELGRGVILGLKYGTRTDISDLRDEYPEKAKRFEELRDELDPGQPSSALQSNMPELQEKKDRHDTAHQLDEIIEEIRKIEKFKNFLRPLSKKELIAAASLGPIVMINTSPFRCDALLIRSEGIEVLPLPRLTLKEIQSKAKQSISVALLEWLWETIASPILDKLGYQETPTGKWPRIWWIATGLMSRLPLHAAGRHYENTSETVIDRVISSYSSSVRALVYARKNAIRKDLKSPKALLVAMRKTPGVSDLICADQEIDILDQVLPAYTSKDTLLQPQKADIMDKLSSYSIFHFAGHGRPHPLDPSKSCLLLSNWQEDPLTVEDLASLQLQKKSPWLSYLSACSTGESEVEKLQDETLHLVSACQLAGFPHVIGSLWEIDDQYSVYMAREVYKTIVKSGWTDEGVAVGVHNAVRFLRRETRGMNWGAGYAIRDEGKPFVWGSYIHAGP